MAVKNNKIVFIEDDEVTVRMYGLRFEAAGVPMLVALTGQAGLDLVKKEKPGLVLLDIKLPDMDGFEVLKKLKASPQTKDIPVIVFSNIQRTGNIEKAKKLGALEFVMKTSVLPKEMVAKVKALLP
ncbi:MAG: response regulator [bacterium]